MLAAYSTLFASSAACYLHTTLRGKIIVTEQLLDQLQLTGDEIVLDLGCGRGLVLLAAARRLVSGTAIGVDLWRTADQSGNSPEQTWSNARAVGVEDRIELRTGDLAALPLDDASVDVVVSSLAIHNLATPDGRGRAIREAIRVLRPGGRLMIADIMHVSDYQRELRAHGMAGVQKRSLGWRFWYGGPWGATELITARKPDPQTP